MVGRSRTTKAKAATTFKSGFGGKPPAGRLKRKKTNGIFMVSLRHPRNLFNEEASRSSTTAGYQAVLKPGLEEFGRMPKAGHYIVVANSRSADIAKGLVVAASRPDWQVSLNHLGGYQDFTHAVRKGGVELIRQIIRTEYFAA